MRQRRRGRLDTFFGRDFKRAFEGELDLARGFFACVPMCHDAGPFDDLGNEAFVTFFGRIPDTDFVVARVRTNFHSLDTITFAR